MQEIFSTSILTIDSCHDETDLCCVGCTGEMGIYLLGFVLVQADESVQDIVASQRIIVSSLVIWEVVLHWADWQLLLKSIDLVQEQDNRGLDEPSRVADGIKQCEGLLHAVDSLVFEQKLIILRNGNQEENGGDILEAVDPLLSLRSLSSHIKHTVGEVANDEGGLGDTSGLDTRAEDILIVWHVVGLCDAVDVVKVAARVRSRTGIIEFAETYYLAESFNWYSRERLKQSWTPASFHKAPMAPPTSGGRLSPSICCGCIKIVWTWYSAL